MSSRNPELRGAGSCHNAMREAREARRHFGPEGEKVPDLPVFLPGSLRRANQLEVWAWLRVILNVRRNMGFTSTDCISAPCRQMLFAMRTVFLAHEIVCSAFEVLPSLAFHLRVLPISELVCAPVD